MTTYSTPQQAASAVTDHPELPDGTDERFVGFGVMGLPFASGHYLALRDFPATTFAPGYRSVWHRDPAGVWTFYATTPGPQSCARYFSGAIEDPVRCAIDVSWDSPWSLRISMPGLLEWTLELRSTAATSLMTRVGTRLPQGAWTQPGISAMLSRIAGALLGVGQARLSGTAPNGQRFMLAPTRLWAVTTSSATLHGDDLGPIGPLREQARLGDFRPPQKGIFVVGHGHFENFDGSRHRTSPDGRILST